MASAKRTNDHNEIRNWVESKGGRPSVVEGTSGMLRIDFGEPDQRLENTDWDRFFEVFDKSDVDFLYDPEGYMVKFVSKEMPDHGRATDRGGQESGSSRTSRGGRKKSSNGRKKTSAPASSDGRKKSSSGRKKSSDGRKKSSSRKASDGRKKSTGGRKKSSDGRKTSSSRKASDGRKKSSGRKKSADGRKKTTGRKKSTAGRKKSSGRKKSTDGRKKSSGRKKSTNGRKKTSGRKKSSGRKYGPRAQVTVGRVMHEYKEGDLRSGGKGGKVRSRKQAIAIGLSEARRKGDKVPPRRRSGKRKK